MKMRKLAAMALLTITVAATSTCFAIERSDLNFGGIYLDQSIEAVTAMYGQPIKKTPGAPKGWLYTFASKGQTITISDKGKVASATVRGNGDIATKAGIKIGSSASYIKEAYGTPSGDTVLPEPYPDGTTRTIWYRKPTSHPDYQGNPIPYVAHLSFGIDASGRVVWMNFGEEYLVP